MAGLLESGRPDLFTSTQIGQLAGQVWHYLNVNGETSVLRLKAEMQSPAGLIHLALGWLLREEKIEFSGEKGYPAVRLK